MTKVSHLLAMGLPEAGKTTFLAALWHVTESEEVSGSLALERISDDAKHLNTIRNDWLRLMRVGRTVSGQEQYSPTLWLRDPEGRVGQVMFPDLSGETFERAWVDRQWKKEYDEAVLNAEGLLLFVHPEKIKEPYTIAEMQRLSEAAFPEDADVARESQGPEDDDEGATTALERWSPEKAPTQAQLVDLVQFVEHRSNQRRPIRLAVIISAWDLVKDDYQGIAGPTGWLKKRLPYLDQYLRSNFEQFEVEVYGVSAQGGDLEKDKEYLRGFDRASERILIEGPNSAPHDISEPIRWCLGWRTQTTP